MTQWVYRVFGCTLRSNHPLDELRAWAETEISPCTITLEFVGNKPLDLSTIEQAPLYPVTPRWHEAIYRVARLTDGRVRMLLDGSLIGSAEYFDFILSADGAHIRLAWADEMPFQDIVPYLLNACLGAALRLRGVLCLHGNALLSGGRAIILVGGKGAGKSTTTNALIDAGALLLSDDIAPLRWQAGVPFVETGYPRLRLRRDTVAQLYGAADALPAVWTERPYPLNKRYRPLDATQFNAQAHPLSAIYWLAGRHDGLDLPIFKPLEGVARIMALAGNTFANYVLNTEGRRAELAQIQQLAQQIPVIQVTLPHDLGALAAISAALHDDVRHR